MDKDRRFIEESFPVKEWKSEGHKHGVGYAVWKEAAVSKSNDQNKAE